MTEPFEILPPSEEAAPIVPPAKWLRNLFYIHIASIVLSLPTLIFINNPVTPWLGNALSAGIALCLFYLAPANTRFRTAAILTVVSVGLSVLSQLMPNSLLTIGISILSIIAAYQEFHGHAEIIEEKDPKLSRRWKNLFVWQIVIGVIAGFSSVAAVVIMVLAEMDLDRITTWVAGAVILVSLIPGVLYLVYLRRMIALVEE